MQLPLFTSGETEDQGPQGRFATHPSWRRTEVRCLQSQAVETEPLLKITGGSWRCKPRPGLVLPAALSAGQNVFAKWTGGGSA